MDDAKEKEISISKSRMLSFKSSRQQIIRPSEVILIAVFVIIVVVLAVFLFNRLALKRDAANARTVSDKAIASVQERDGNAVWSLGTPTFQKSYTPSELTQDFKNITIATLKPPVLDQESVVDTSSGRTIFFIYRYTALKVPYFIRTAMVKKSGVWKLTALTGNADESQLIIN
jgi:hypothetical protein